MERANAGRSHPIVWGCACALLALAPGYESISPAALVKSDIVKWGDVIKQAGIRGE